MSAFLGMRGTGDWVTNERPENWRQGILYLYPNGSAPLTAMLSKMGEERTDDPHYHWWTKSLPDQAGSFTAGEIYTNSSMTSAYASGGVVGSQLYVKVTEAVASEFRAGHQVLLRDASDFTLDVNAKVLTVTKNGNNSCIHVKLLEADDNSSQSHDLSDADRIMIVGNINSEGAAMPSAVSYNPVEYSNYTQIFRTPLSITRTAQQTRYRTGEKYKEMKREALELHSIEMEWASLFGIPSQGTGDNGKPERTTMGFVNWLRTYKSTNVNDFRLNSTYTGKAWTDVGGGETWLDYYLELVFRYGRAEKLGLAGSGAILGLTNLIKAGAHITWTVKETVYGITVTEWKTPFGTIYLKTHPLFSRESTMRNAILIMEPQEMKYRYIQDTKFFGESDEGNASSGTNSGRLDGKNEEFLTEAGYEFHHPDCHMFLDGLNCTNIV